MSTPTTDLDVVFDHVETPDDRVVVPAGTYVVGDACYTVADAHWHDYLVAADPDCFADEGTNPNPKPVKAATIDGFHVVSVGTAHGDGRYDDAEGRVYAVDSGTIGLVAVGYAKMHGKPVRDDLTSVIIFDTDVECFYDDTEGTIRLGAVAIKTDPEPEPFTCWVCGRRSDSPDYCTWGCTDEEEDANDDDE